MSFKLLLNTILICLLSILSGNPIDKDGTFKGQRLCGKVKVVTSGEAFKVKVVDSFEHIKVKLVNSFPDDVGEWQIVNSFEDFRVRFVDSHEDFRIKFVESFPGRSN